MKALPPIQDLVARHKKCRLECLIGATQAMPMHEPENWVTVADRHSIEMDSVTAVKVGDVDIAVYNVAGQFSQLMISVTHAQRGLAGGQCH